MHEKKIKKYFTTSNKPTSCHFVKNFVFLRERILLHEVSRRRHEVTRRKHANSSTVT